MGGSLSERGGGPRGREYGQVGTCGGAPPPGGASSARGSATARVRGLWREQWAAANESRLQGRRTDATDAALVAVELILLHVVVVEIADGAEVRPKIGSCTRRAEQYEGKSPGSKLDEAGAFGRPHGAPHTSQSALGGCSWPQSAHTMLFTSCRFIVCCLSASWQKRHVKSSPQHGARSLQRRL